VIQDGDLTLAESAACIEYIVNKYGNGKFTVPPSAPNYAEYLYWWYWCGINLPPRIFINMILEWSDFGPDNDTVKLSKQRLGVGLGLLEERLGKSTWLAGDEFTIADIMPVFSLTTGRLFYSYSLSDYPNILSWLKRISEREAFQRACKKGDPGLAPLIGPDAPEPLKKG
jgi:glutathione S-transferase